MVATMEVQTACHSAKVPPPPPRPPNADLRAKVPPPPEPPDTGSLAVTLPRPVPPPKPPNLDAELLAEASGSLITETFEGSTLLKKRPRMGWEFYKMGQNLDLLGQAQIYLSNEVHQRMSHEKRLLLNQISLGPIHEKCRGESVELVDIKANQRYTLLVQSPGCAQLPPAIPSKPPPWRQVTTKISVAPTPPPEPPDPGARAAPLPLPESLVSSLRATHRGAPIAEHIEALSMLKKVRRVDWGFDKLGPTLTLIGKLNICLNLVFPTQSNVCVLRKRFQSWANEEKVVLPQFIDYVWLQKKRIVDSPIQGLISVFADPILSPAYCERLATLTKCVLSGKYLEYFAWGKTSISQAVGNTYGKALEHTINCDRGHIDIEANVHGRIQFSIAWFDALGICLDDEAAVSMLYSVLRGTSAFLEHALVPIYMDTWLVPILEALSSVVNGQRRQYIVFVGVSRAGKSTNLAKVAYWILQHHIKAMLAAGYMLLEGTTPHIFNHKESMINTGKRITFRRSHYQVEGSNCKLRPKCSKVETVWRVQMFEAGSSNSQKWDPGGSGLVFNDYCTRRTFRGCCYGAQEASHLMKFVLQWCFVHVLVAALLHTVAAAVLPKLFTPSFFGALLAVHAKAIKDKLYSEDKILISDLRTSLFFKRLAMLGPQMRVWAQVGLVHQLPIIFIMRWQRERVRGEECDVREFCYKNWG